MKICVVGTGYVGLSLSVLLSQKHQITALDISDEKIKLINNKKSPIKDLELEDYLQNKSLKLNATLNKDEAYSNADYVIIATPTNYDVKTGSFDTSSVEQVISDCIVINPEALIIIKSTIPLGFTDSMRQKFQKRDIIFSPEFLRESNALYDNLYPSRIVIGDDSKKALEFGKILINCSLKSENEVQLLCMDSKEAEAVKLFSNTFLAMRISFFNELDSFAEIQNLSSEKIIEGVSADQRIGNYYNNPSFGYGGYCLPKDTKQLLDNFNKIPNNIIKAVVESNKTRKKFIVNSILNKFPGTVGVYRLIMKEGSDNFRESAVLDIIEELRRRKIKIILYEPLITEKQFKEIEVIRSISDFISKSDLVIANRLSSDLIHVRNKVYSRDIFQKN
tara:strand:+ start:103 stop:1275 length:1173 start_codon:yes stop_codon:yes gene_type:complete